MHPCRTTHRRSGYLPVANTLDTFARSWQRRTPEFSDGAESAHGRVSYDIVHVRVRRAGCGREDRKRRRLRGGILLLDYTAPTTPAFPYQAVPPRVDTTCEARVTKACASYRTRAQRRCRAAAQARHAVRCSKSTACHLDFRSCLPRAHRAQHQRRCPENPRTSSVGL